MKTTKSGEQALISGANAGNSNEYLIYLASPTNLRLYTGSSATAGVSWNLPHSIADGQWHHVAVVRDDTRNRADLYLEGTWVGAWGVALDPIDLEPGGLLVGQDQDSVGGGFQAAQAFSGTLDEMRLYTRVLSAGEIAELAEADTTPPSAPPVLSATADVLRVDLAWTAADDPESGIGAYEIRRGTVSGGSKTLLARVPGTQTSYPDARTSPTTAYYYEVLAVNGSGLSGLPSPEAGAATAAGSGDPALVGWWKLDETAGIAAVDSSDYGLDGAWVNGPVWDPDGQLGGALAFNVNEPPDDPLDDRVDLDAQILDGAENVTAALWVKTTKTGIQGLVSGANAGNDAEYELVLLSNPDLRLRFYTGETNETYVVWPVPGVADGTWHHLAVTRNAAADQAVLYVDGTSQGSRGATFNQLSVDAGGLLLGQEQDSVGGGFDPAQAFSGSLDDVRLYRRLLSDTEIADLAGLAPPDTTPPVITLLGDAFVTVEAGDSYVDAGATALDDVDGDITGSIVVVNPVDQGTVGTYVVTYDVEDSSGNPAVQVTRTVEVVDTTPPVITLLGNSLVTVEAGSVYTDAGATASTIVDGDMTGSIVVGGVPVDTATPGSHVVTYDVVDSSGNAAVQVTRTVEVVDTGIPVITLLGSSPVTVEAGGSYVDAGATALDDVDGDITGSIVVGGVPVDTATLGSYVVTYDVVDSSGNAAVQVTRTVDVVDTRPPVITLLGSSPVTVEAGSAATSDAGATAFDDVDGDITGSIVVGGLPVDTATLGSYVVTYDVEDSSGNAAVQVTRTVNVVDTTPPVITLNGDPVVTVEAGSVYTDAGATALDIVDGDLTGSIVIVNTVDTGAAGTYVVTYDVSDSSDNAAVQVTRTVEVVPPAESDVVYVSSTSGGTVGGVSFQDEDILAYDTATDSWSMFFDGSDVGLNASSSLDVDAFELLADGSLLLSFVGPASVGNLGTVDDSDIVRFVPTSLGGNTAGSFEWYFDGSDVGLTTNGEDVDAITLLADGRIIISTTGGFSVPGASGADEDLVVFTPTALGAETSGTWALYFDGSDVALNNASSEDVNGVWVDGGNGEVYLTTLGAFSVAGASGSGADIFVFVPTSLGASTAGSFAPYWEGAAYGWGAEVTDGIHIGS